MKSKTKSLIQEAKIRELFAQAGITQIHDISPLGAGEYNAVFAASDGNTSYALKIAPPAELKVLSYEKELMHSEVFWYEQIRKHTSICVPKVFYADFSREQIPTPYFIMELLPGKQLNEMDFSAAERTESIAAKAKMAAQIHKISGEGFGYLQTGLKKTWYEAISSMVQSLIDDCHSLGQETEDGKRLLAYIDTNKEILEEAKCVMVNFDLWDSNVLCTRENGELHFAWIDPERSFWGDPIADFVSMSRDPLEPLSLKKAEMEAYNTVAAVPVTGSKQEDIRYAVALGYLALIQETEKYVRYEPGDKGWTNSVNESESRYAAAFAVLEK